MCIICVEFQKGTLTAAEARNAYSEMLNVGDLEKDHVTEIEAFITKEEVSEAIKENLKLFVGAPASKVTAREVKKAVEKSLESWKELLGEETYDLIVNPPTREEGEGTSDS